MYSIEFTTRAILILDFKYNSFLKNDIKILARKTIEKAANKATVDYNQEPVEQGNSQELTILEYHNIIMA